MIEKLVDVNLHWMVGQKEGCPASYRLLQLPGRDWLDGDCAMKTTRTTAYERKQVTGSATACHSPGGRQDHGEAFGLL
jgi:hypothetical protein